jgi:hypothetical protein
MDFPVVVPGHTATGKTRMSTAEHEQGVILEAGFFVGRDILLHEAMPQGQAEHQI